MRARVAVSAASPLLLDEAAALGRDLALPVKDDEADVDFLLTLTPERLELREVGGRTKPLFIDLLSGKAQYRQAQAKREPLARAVGVKGSYRPSVLDATAGLGQDAYLLAAEGCRVQMVERSPVIAALLRDGLKRARASGEAAETLARLTLSVGDAAEVMGRLEARPDVVYLDPMYPDSGKSAAKRKEMRFFRALVGDDPDAEQLLTAALSTARRRVVVKRPVKGEALRGPRPDASLPGKTTRFDLYLLHDA